MTFCHLAVSASPAPRVPAAISFRQGKTTNKTHNVLADNFDPNDPNDGALMNPPEPPPGDPLLTDSDSRFLSSFFEDMTADQYNMPSFGEGLNFSNAWFDLPPQFMGTTTSFGQQPMHTLASPTGQHMQNESMDFGGNMAMSNMMPPPPPPGLSLQPHQGQLPQQQHAQQHHGQQHGQLPHSQQHGQRQPQVHNHIGQHSDDVLNAAATLLQNGSSPLRNSHTPDYGLPRRSMGPPLGHLRHQPLEDFQEDGRRNLDLLKGPQEPGVADWFHAAPGKTPTPRNDVPTAFQWGSDSNFNPVQGYTPDVNNQTVESMHREQLKLLEGLEVSKSAASTRPSSPSNAHAATHVDHARQPHAPPKRDEDSEAPPRKRRKSKNTRDTTSLGHDDEEEQISAKVKGGRKSKSDRENPDSSPPAESVAGSSGKKRKSATNGPKPSRENLSEAQKRENHIKSEQKRRTLIKDGFDDLCELVPSLRGGGFSKSAMLSVAGDWLDELLQGNEALNDQLSAMKR